MGRYVFLLPLVWLNILFGNQVVYPDIAALGQVFYWLMLLNVAYLFLMEGSRKRILMLVFFCVMIVFRLVAIGVEQVYPLYLACAGIVFSLAGFLFFQNEANLFKRQIVFFVVFSIPIMFLQIVGYPEILQYFNTLYVKEMGPGIYVMPEITKLDLFLNYSKRIDLWYVDQAYYHSIAWQVRPPGLLHSSAMLAPVVLAALILQLSELAGRHYNVKDLLVLVAVVLTGSKMALYGTIILLMITYHYSPYPTRRSALKLLLALGIFLLLYFIIFPLAFATTYSLDSISVSFGGRIYDLLVYFRDYIPLSDIIQMATTLSEASARMDMTGITDAQGYSGILTLVYALPFILVLWVIVGPLYRRRLKRLDKENTEKTLFIRLSLAWIVLVLLATPLTGAPFYSMFVGITLTPLLINHRDIQKYFAVYRALKIPVGRGVVQKL